jgi:hypothetical protein
MLKPWIPSVLQPSILPNCRLFTLHHSPVIPVLDKILNKNLTMSLLVVARVSMQRRDAKVG